VNAIVSRAGFLTTVQDLGRIGFRQFGVSSGGALDLHALRVANLLVGNQPSLAGIEITFGGLRLHFEDDRVIAWCGGEFDVRVGSTSMPAGHACLVCPDKEVKFDPPKIGCRGWLAISGGIDVPFVLGSRSTDLRASFGGFRGRTLRDGDRIPLGKISRATKILTEKLREEKIARWSPPHGWSNSAKPEPVLRFIRGHDWNRFSPSTLQRLTSETFAVSPDSDRMGVRLDGPELHASGDVNFWSEAVAPGTIQVPPGGKPILLLGDCQTIGGYPKIAHVITVDLSVAAQLRAADQVRFREVSPGDADQFLLEREHNLEQFRRGLEVHFK
jgi:antagonist of KipI